MENLRVQRVFMPGGEWVGDKFWPSIVGMVCCINERSGCGAGVDNEGFQRMLGQGAERVRSGCGQPEVPECAEPMCRAGTE